MVATAALLALEQESQLLRPLFVPAGSARDMTELHRVHASHALTRLIERQCLQLSHVKLGQHPLEWLMHQETVVLAEKIRSLSPEQINEVEHFIEFLRLRGEESGLTRAAAAMSVPAFEVVWANPEDDAYDAL